MRMKLPAAGAAAILAALLCLPVYATTVLQMSLDDLATRADRVFRGTVLSVEPGTVAVGGGTLPTVIYELAVEEEFKGQYPAGKNIVTVTMIGNLKGGDRIVNGQRRLASLPEVPRLRMGGTYVLFTTQPSSGGLSTTVGLGQGSFKIYLSPTNEEMAANELNNAGLFSGPVTYTQLAGAIRATIN